MHLIDVCLKKPLDFQFGVSGKGPLYLGFLHSHLHLAFISHPRTLPAQVTCKPGWLSPVNVTNPPPQKKRRRPGVCCGNGKPRAGALGLELIWNARNANPFGRYLKRTNQRVGWVGLCQSPNVAIDRTQESATGSIKQTHSNTELRSVFCRIVIPTLTSSYISNNLLPLHQMSSPPAVTLFAVIILSN